MRYFRVLWVSSLALGLLASSALATAVLPGQGVTFSQVGFNYPGVSPQSFSQSGQAFANYASLFGNGFSNGYLNVVTGNGWQVQNLPVDALSGVSGLSMIFDLGSPSPISNLNAYVDFSPTPLGTAPSGIAQNFGVGSITTNAEGDGAPRTTNPAPPPGPLTFIGAVSELLGFQPGHPASVEQDVNQCGPASLSNSLQYLQNRYGNPVGGQNIPGIAGAPPNSRVGEIDTDMGRAAGQGVTNNAFITGKLKYMADHGLGGLTVDHQGGDGVIGTGNFTSSGITSHYAGAPTAAWILDQLRKGEDVELNIRWTGGGGHWVTLIGGWNILGQVLVAFNNDYKQGMAGGTGLLDGGYGASFLTTDINGNLLFKNFFDGATARVNFVVAESVPEPGVALLTILGVLCMAWYHRRRKRVGRAEACPTN